jgi:hypothetical protein
MSLVSVKADCHELGERGGRGVECEVVCCTSAPHHPYVSVRETITIQQLFNEICNYSLPLGQRHEDIIYTPNRRKWSI